MITEKDMLECENFECHLGKPMSVDHDGYDEALAYISIEKGEIKIEKA